MKTYRTCRHYHTLTYNHTCENCGEKFMACHFCVRIGKQPLLCEDCKLIGSHVKISEAVAEEHGQARDQTGEIISILENELYHIRLDNGDHIVLSSDEFLIVSENVKNRKSEND